MIFNIQASWATELHCLSGQVNRLPCSFVEWHLQKLSNSVVVTSNTTVAGNQYFFPTNIFICFIS